MRPFNFKAIELLAGPFHDPAGSARLIHVLDRSVCRQACRIGLVIACFALLFGVVVGAPVRGQQDTTERFACPAKIPCIGGPA